jgi:hypothetical protein
MSTAGGPKITSDNLVLCLDAHDAKSYPGQPVTNVCYLSYGDNQYLAQAYDWDNSGAATRNRNATDIRKPKVGIDARNIRICSCVCTTTGSQHFGMGYIAISASTQYTVSLYYMQNRAGIGGPYIRQVVNNNNLGSLKWIGRDGKQDISGSSNWPVNEWIRLKAYATTSSNETHLYISNYIGTTVGDKVWSFGPQIETGSKFSPLVRQTRSTTDAWKDRSGNDYDGDFVGGIATRVSHHKKGQVIEPKSNAYLDFDGTDDYVSIPHSSAIMLARTWSCWFYLDSVPDSSTSDSIFQKDDNWNTHSGTMLSMIYGNLRFGWGTYWAADCSISLSGNITTGKWYHFTGTSTGDTTSGGVKMYLDGALKDTGTANGVPTDTSILKIGSGNGGPINGRIANFTLYSTELTAAQIKANFNAQRGRYGV